VEKGLHISPWWVATVLGLPFAMAMWSFFAKLLPDPRTFLFPHRMLPQVMLTALSSFTVFVFFGGVGVYGYGQVSHWISLMSLSGLFPAVLIFCWPRNTGIANAQVAAGGSV
jgi:hypothetical protein